MHVAYSVGPKVSDSKQIKISSADNSHLTLGYLNNSSMSNFSLMGLSSIYLNTI